MESMQCPNNRQQAYYESTNNFNDAGEPTVFVEFMLSTIKASLIDTFGTSDAMSNGKIYKVSIRCKLIEEFLQAHDYIMNADVRELCGVSAATANRILASLVTERKLVKCRKVGHWAYKMNRGELVE